MMWWLSIRLRCCGEWCAHAYKMLLDCVILACAACVQELPKDLLERAKNMRPPRDRITCLLIGNHSAGKSSFTNWLIARPHALASCIILIIKRFSVQHLCVSRGAMCM